MKKSEYKAIIEALKETQIDMDAYQTLEPKLAISMIASRLALWLEIEDPQFDIDVFSSSLGLPVEQIAL